MSARTGRRLAWVAFAVFAVVYAAGLVLGVRNLGVDRPGIETIDPLVLTYLVFALVGAPVAARDPRNPVGWLLLGVAHSWAWFLLLSEYGVHGLVSHPGSLPAPELALAINTVTWVPAVGLMGTFLLLLFPDGHLPSRRWRPVAWASGVALVLLVPTGILSPGGLDDAGMPDVENPWGVPALAGVVDGVGYGAVVLLLASVLASAASEVVRFRRSRGLERLQLKWLAAGSGLTAISYVSLMVLSITGWLDEVWLDRLGVLALGSFALIPLSIGYAMLRHRLYGIDVIIRTALVYGAMTAALTVVYVSGVLVTGVLVRAVGGRADGLSVAVSTLAVAGLFGPLRRRLQTLVDKRFYRSRYDARGTLDAFAGTVRHELDVAALQSELVAVVDTALRPTSLSVWLRPAPQAPSLR